MVKKTLMLIVYNENWQGISTWCQYKMGIPVQKKCLQDKCLQDKLILGISDKNSLCLTFCASPMTSNLRPHLVLFHYRNWRVLKSFFFFFKYSILWILMIMKWRWYHVIHSAILSFFYNAWLQCLCKAQEWTNSLTYNHKIICSQLKSKKIIPINNLFYPMYWWQLWLNFVI